MLVAANVRRIQELEIRTLESIDDFLKAEQVQQETWGYGDREIAPASIFAVAHNFGGQTIGAFDGDRIVAFALSFGAVDAGHAHLHSHMVGVVPEYQNSGLGKRIKLAQRDDALARDIDQIMWTFDPLQVRNAYFNLVKLGGIGVRYIPNLYGMTSSPLHGGIPTDRLLIAWNLTSERVVEILAGKLHESAANAVVVPIPPASPSLALAERIAAQAALREQMLSLFDDGFGVTGFVHDEGSARYILEKL